MLPYDSVMAICILSTFINIIPLCLSQNTTTTNTPTTTEEAGFLSASTTEILILVAVIIGCPICILLLCKWQKNKTAKFTKSRQEHLDRITAGAMQRQQIQMAQAQQRAGLMSTNGVPIHSQSPSQQPMIHHGEMNERHSQNPAQSINGTNARPLQLIADAPSDDPDTFKPPPPAGPAPVPSRAQSVQPVRNKGKRSSIAKQPKEFNRRQTEMVHGSKRAIIAQNTSKDAQRQKSNSVLQRKANGQFSSKGVPAPPSEPPPASPKEAKPKRDVALDMLIQSPEQSPKHQPPPAWTTSLNDKNKSKNKKAPNFMKVQSVSGVGNKVDMESALILPDVEDDVDDDAPPEAIPRTKTFDAKTGAPIEIELDAVVNGDNKNRERIKTEDIERSLSIPVDDDAKGNMSDSSSGEPLDDNDKNLLQIAHQQMESKPPPSLQTIFGRKVINKDEESESEDSLLKRQQDFEQGKETEIAMSKPESTFVLNV